MAVITTDSPISRRIVRAFVNFLDSVEPVPGVDLEGLEVAKDCLTEIFKLDKYSVDDDARCDSLVDIFKSVEANKQSVTIKSGIGDKADSVDASSSLFAQNASLTKDHLGSSKSLDNDWTEDPQTFEGVSKDEFCGKFFAALEKIHFFRTRSDGSDDPVQLEKASHIFDEGILEMERSGCQELNLRNLAESLKSLGNKAMQSKKYTDAIELYGCAIALCDNAVYYCNRAAAYTQIHKNTDAIQDCLRSIEIDPNYSKAYSRLGLAYYAQGNYRDAIDKGFKKALQLDPNNESVKENIRVAEQKLLEHRHHPNNGQHSRWFQEFQNHSAQGSTNHEAPPTFNSMPFNPSDMASMFMNMATNVAHGQGPQERQAEDRSNSSETNEPEIRIGHNVSINLGEMPEDVTGAIRSVMEMLSGAAAPHGQPQDHMNGRSSSN